MYLFVILRRDSMLFDRLFGFGESIGIDLGTATVLVYIKGKGIVLREPSVVAIDRSTNTVLAVGDEARDMIGKTPGSIVAIRPLKEGVISDYETTERMLKYFIKKSIGRHPLAKPTIAVCVPSGITEVEKRAVEDATRQAGARAVHIIEEPIAAAIGSGIDIGKACGSMVIDIGGGTTDIAVISLGGIVVSKSIKVAGDNFDDAIIKYMRKKHNLLIGERSAEQLKINIGTAYKRTMPVEMEVKGRDLVTGLPKSIVVHSEEMHEALYESVELIGEAVHTALEQTPPELAADISDRGIVMTGGGSLLYGLDKYISEITQIDVIIADDAVSCVATGTGRFIEYIEGYKTNKRPERKREETSVREERTASQRRKKKKRRRKRLL